MPDLRLSLALNDYVHTADIANGRVRAPGIDLTIVSLPFESVAMRFGANLEFDVAEYSLANYCAHLAEPKPSPMVALPVFTSRVFRHSSIYVNDASSIVDAGDLAGRTVGIPQWSQTATVYVRGFLTHDAGVPLRSIRWVQAGVDQPGRRDGVQSYLPEGVTVTPRPDRTLSDLLASGEIDAVISARPPQCFMQGAPGVRRLFPDFRQEEERYFARTGIFPIMHVIAMRRPVYEANPWIARNLLRRLRNGQAGGLGAPARYPDLASAVGVGHRRDGARAQAAVSRRRSLALRIGAQPDDARGLSGLRARAGRDPAPARLRGAVPEGSVVRGADLTRGGAPVIPGTERSEGARNP